jgi:PAS domain S-box-containing protein
MIAARPTEFESEKMTQLEILTLRVANTVEIGRRHFAVDEKPAGFQSLSLAELAITSLSSDVHDLERAVAATVYERRSDAIQAMSQTGRDQLVLFLILLFAIPVFIGFVPVWVVRPLIRLKHIEQRIEEGRIRELAVSGNDEVSQLARAIKDALMWREELDVRKSTKIFEIRNVLRAVIGHVNEPVIIIDRTGRINYANQPASQLLRVETHYLEGSGLGDHFFSTELTKAVAAALSGDIDDAGVKTRLEFRDGRVVSMLARLSAVHDRAGGVSRVVMVLVPEAPLT